MKALAITLALVGIASCAQAETLRSYIDKMEKTIGTAMKNKDSKTYIKILTESVTPDFKYTEMGKTENFKEMLSTMKVGLTMMKTITRADGVVQSIKESGNKATVLMKRTMSGTVVPGKDKKTHTMGYTGLCTDTYVKVGGKWKLSSMTWGKQTMFMDGKAVNPETGQ